MNTAAPALGARVGEQVKWQSKIYNTVVTPINFVTFIVSLYLIDNQYRTQRYLQHEADERPWLQRLFYRHRSSPYDRVDSNQGQSLPQSANTTHRHGAGTKNGDDAPRPVKETGDAWYYHTKQKKLFKLEAADAFALRNLVLLALCFLVFSVGWMLWRVVVWLIA
ncbi:hypothetical protein F4680DRAFT_438025 [Xylaria scruposa]|nr:hypothetical protein F4680DRAFT_438025 [Xylaria scruposa]